MSIHLSAGRCFFFNDTPTTEIYTLSLHDALPIGHCSAAAERQEPARHSPRRAGPDRKSTRLNSSPLVISYAVFCLKKTNCTAEDCSSAVATRNDGRNPKAEQGV